MATRLAKLAAGVDEAAERTSRKALRMSTGPRSRRLADARARFRRGPGVPHGPQTAEKARGQKTLVLFREDGSFFRVEIFSGNFASTACS